MSTPREGHTSRKDAALAASADRGADTFREPRAKGGHPISVKDEYLRRRDERGYYIYRNTAPRYCGCIGQVIVQAGRCIKCGNEIDL